MTEIATDWWPDVRAFAPWIVLQGLLPGAALFALLLWLSQRFVREGVRRGPSLLVRSNCRQMALGQSCQTELELVELYLHRHRGLRVPGCNRAWVTSLLHEGAAQAVIGRARGRSRQSR